MLFFRHKEKIITSLLLLFIFLMRIPYLSNSPFEMGESWRQSDTEAMARNFVDDRFHILYPQLNYDGAPPNYAQLELQITTFLIAILYKMFGYHYELARLIPILFFIGSAYYLYLIARKYYTLEVAWISMLLYSLMPLNLFYSRAIMPESAALFFFLGAFFLFSEWIDKERNWQLISAALMTALAIAIKTPAIFVGIPMLIMSIMKFKSRIFYSWQLWLFASFSLLMPFMYFKWLESVAEFTFVSSIGAKHILPKFATALFTPEAMSFFQTHFPHSFTWMILALLLPEIIMIKWKTEYPIGLLMLAMVLEVLTIVAVIQFNYYLVFIGPPVALIAGKALGYLLRWKYGVVPLILFLTVLGFVSFSGVESRYEEKHTLLKQAELIKQYTEKDDLIVIGTLSPELLNASGRKGWRANIDYYEYIPRGPQAEIDYFISQGASYFVPVKGYIYNDPDHAYRNYLEENFKKIIVENHNEYFFYQLQ